MPSSPLEWLQVDVLELIFHHICISPTHNRQPPVSIESNRLLPLSIVSKTLRELTLPWIFYHFRWRPDRMHSFIPAHLSKHVKTLSLAAIHEPNFNKLNKHSLISAFASLHSTASLKVYGLWGSSNFFYPIIASMPVLESLEWIDAPLLVELDAPELQKLTRLGRLVYKKSTEDYPSRPALRSQSNNLLLMMQASRTTLEHIEIPGIFARFDVMATLGFYNLRTLLLVELPPDDPTPLASVLDRTPNLRTLETRFHKEVRRFTIYPEKLDGDASSQQHRIPDLRSFTLYNPSSTDGLVTNLPSSLRFLSFLQHPYPYGFTSTEDESRLVLGTTPSDGRSRNWPELNTTQMLHLLQKSGAIQLRELRISFMGPVPTSWILNIGMTFPVLEVFELHRWSQDVKEAVPTLEFYIPALSTLSRLRELLLDMHLSDEVPYDADAPAQKSRAELAVQRIPSLLTVGFLQGEARLWYRSLPVAIYWEIFDVKQREPLLEVQLRDGFYQYCSEDREIT